MSYATSPLTFKVLKYLLCSCSTFQLENVLLKYLNVSIIKIRKNLDWLNSSEKVVILLKPLPSNNSISYYTELELDQSIRSKSK